MADDQTTRETAVADLAAPRDALPEDPVASVAHPEFRLVLRGYDRAAVDAYVERVQRLVGELHATVSPRAAIREALDRVARETADILRRAHEAAEGTRAAARAEADEIAQAGVARIGQLDRDADVVWHERLRLVAEIRRLAGELERVAAGADERFPPEPPVEAARELPAARTAPPYAQAAPPYAQAAPPHAPPPIPADAEEPR
jgi:DivIVA domain-containing protein